MVKLTQEARKARNEYLKTWRANNKEKVSAANQRYWEKKAKTYEGREQPHD